MSWPLILFGHPSYIQDSVSYVKGGNVAIEFAAGKLFPREGLPASIAPPALAPSSVAVSASRASETKAARSVPYSVAAYLLRWPGNTMTALVLLQILAASFVAAATIGASGVARRRSFALVGVVIAIATPLPVVGAFAVPDILAGILIGALVLLTTSLDRLSTGVRLVLAAISGFAVISHASIPPLAVGFTLVGLAFFWGGPRFGLHRARRAWAWLVLPTVLGIAATAAVGFFAFGEVSIAAKRYPFALARSVSDGPARWYLERHCKTARYAVCEVFGTRIPADLNAFLFNKGSLNDRATPEQMDRIRAEESEIVIRAGLSYPGTEAFNVSKNVLRQLFLYDLQAVNFRDVVSVDAAGTLQLVSTGKDHSTAIDLVETLTYLALAASMAWAVWRFDRLDSRARATLLLVIMGLVINAVICVVFSGIAGRYQARVIWLLPLFILSLFAATDRRSGKPDSHLP